MTTRHCTKQEEEYIHKFYEKRGVSYLAKKLNRTEASVKRKAQSLGHNAYICEDLYIRTVAKCFNCDSRVITRWIEKFGLACRVVQRGKMTCRLIDPKVFWKWASEHKDLIPWSKYERLSILPEPEWVKESIKEYEKKNNRKHITDIEILYVVNYKKKGYSYKYIASELQRTEDSIKHIWRKYKAKNKKGDNM